jgi:DNA-binding response OmpR family regulator
MFSSVLEEPKPAPVSTDGRPTILIVDDDEVLAEVLSRRLEQQGFETLTADSGQSGLAKARRQRPDLVVLDLRLPDSDGFCICEELADSSDTCTIPVIILSGLEQPDILRRCRAVGCQYFLRKPYDPNVLLLLIRQALREASDWGGTCG